MASLRIGYVNVRGLRDRQKWDQCVQLLQSTLDVLFVAETWYIQHQAYRRERYCVASTDKPPLNLLGRQAGGMYLLAHPTTQGQIREVKTT